MNSKKREDAFSNACSQIQDLETFKVAVKRQVAEGFNLLKSDRAKELLGFAIREGKNEHAQFLLDMGVNPSRVAGLLSKLFDEKNFPMLEWLLPFCKGYEPSIIPNNLAIVQLLMKNNCISEQAQYYWGVKNNQVQFVSGLPKRSKFATSCLMYVTTTEMLTLLAKKGAKFQESRLLSFTNSTEIARELIHTYKVSVNDLSRFEEVTPLENQLSLKHYSVAEVIHSAGGRIDPALLVHRLSQIQNDKEMAKWMDLLYDADHIEHLIPGSLHERETLLHHCVKKFYLNSVVLLLRKHFDVNRQLEKHHAGCTALSLLVNGSNVSLNALKFDTSTCLAMWLIHYGSSLIGIRFTYYSQCMDLSLKSQRCIYLYAKLRTLIEDAHLTSLVLKETSYAYLLKGKEVADLTDEELSSSIVPTMEIEDARTCNLTFGNQDPPLENVPAKYLYGCEFFRAMLEEDMEDTNLTFHLPNITCQQIKWICSFALNQDMAFLLEESVENLLGLVVATNYLLNPELLMKVLPMINQKLDTCETEYDILNMLSLSMLSPEQLRTCRRDTDFLLPGLDDKKSTKKQRLVGE